MERNPAALAGQTFDLVIIGGGINGAATAREAALRGLKVALVEARDFSRGTSSRSSKLIHGGLRYLEQFDFRLVHESRRERRLLRRLAPHLARPLPFLLPIYRGDPYNPLKIRLGLTLYDFFGSLGREDRHRMLTPVDALRAIPALRPAGLKAAAVFHDSETDDARLTLEFVLDAAERGAVVANYTEIRAFAASATRAGQILAAEAEDRLTGRRYEISGRFWVNAAGPWVDRVRALVPGYDGSRTVRLTQGVHVILPRVAPHYAMFAAIPSDQRIFILLPWHDGSLLGTTDTDFEGDPAAVQPDAGDVEYLLQAVNRVLAQPLPADQVVGSFAGLRALALEPGRRPAANTREYRFHRDAWAENLISVCGGKLTTARALGEKLMRQIAPCLDAKPSATTLSRTAPLPGGHTGPFDAYVATSAREAARLFDISLPIAERIVRTYGTRWPKVFEPIHRQRLLSQPLPGTPPLLAAEVEFALREEMAVTLEDFLLRRSGLNWAAVSMAETAAAVAELLARRCAWDTAQKAKALAEFAKISGAATGT
jgi:glycerol-3-phosphate dehydrogenase